MQLCGAQGVLGPTPGFTFTSIRRTWVQNLPSAITLWQIRPGHPALSGSLEDPEGSKGNSLGGGKRSPEEVLETAESLPWVGRTLCKTGSNTARKGYAHHD